MRRQSPTECWKGYIGRNSRNKWKCWVRQSGRRLSMRALTKMAGHWIDLMEHVHPGMWTSCQAWRVFGSAWEAFAKWTDLKITLVLKMDSCFIAKRYNDLWVCQRTEVSSNGENPPSSTASWITNEPMGDVCACVSMCAHRHLKACPLCSLPLWSGSQLHCAPSLTLGANCNYNA